MLISKNFSYFPLVIHTWDLKSNKWLLREGLSLSFLPPEDC